MKVSELAAHLGVTWEGEGDRAVKRFAALEAAGVEAVSFVSGGKVFAQAARSPAVLIAPPDYPRPDKQTVLRAQAPRLIAARAIARLHPPLRPPAGVHPSAVVGPGAVLGAHVAVGPGAVLGAGVHVGESTVIGAGCRIGDYARIGAHCVLHAGVTLYAEVTVGDRAILHSGCVIGADGFGFVWNGERYEKFPQIGSVEIGDDVEFGANCTVDRGALGHTIIGDGVKLDNQVHVGHNCRIGNHVVVAAQTGFSGGVVVEDRAVIGGQVGVGDKARIESGAVVGSGAGILTSKIVRAGQVVWGTPARPLKEHLAQLAALARLPELRKELAALRRGRN
jgi:UDP-3-O-[3-hydroxymyristoyl] glucosamine N-acyltransferase